MNSNWGSLFERFHSWMPYALVGCSLQWPSAVNWTWIIIVGFAYACLMTRKADAKELAILAEKGVEIANRVRPTQKELPIPPET
ncbi:MAG: hypothetical protein JST12_14750 [Armatimonadetes bacterium]|nr:hypothetical protein [Armatimonadota bacterium]